MSFPRVFPINRIMPDQPNHAVSTANSLAAPQTGQAGSLQGRAKGHGSRIIQELGPMAKAVEDDALEASAMLRPATQAQIKG